MLNNKEGTSDMSQTMSNGSVFAAAAKKASFTTGSVVMDSGSTTPAESRKNQDD
jgi:hypothetical protein